METYYIAWWNVENLFDMDTAPRSKKLQKKLGKELKGWNASVLTKKIAQLGKVITQMNEGAGPDILGLRVAITRLPIMTPPMAEGLMLGSFTMPSSLKQS